MANQQGPSPSRRGRTAAWWAAVATIAGSIGTVGAGGPAMVSAAPPDDVVGEPCAPGVGVTVVVDYQQLGGVEIGCVPGEQASGFEALTNAGFTVNDDPGGFPGTVCQIRGVPEEGYPYCWTEGGFWGYWKSDGAEPWQWSAVGASSGPLAIDRVEGWSWTSPIPPDYSGEPMRITVDEVADEHVPVASGWSSISAGDASSCGVRTGVGYCWGDDASGQLGNGPSPATRNRRLRSPRRPACSGARSRSVGRPVA